MSTKSRYSRRLAPLLLLLSAPAAVLADSSPPSAIHGFASIQLGNDYLTPRGLLVTNKGVTGQALAGLVLVLPANFSLVAGSWNDLDGFHPTPGTTHGGAHVEEDYFAGVNYQATKRLKLSATYDIWTFPQGPAPYTEQNIEFVAAYDDSSPGSSFSFQPHAEVFWSIASKSSVVVLGKPGDDGTTAYLELGVTPTLKLTSVPVTFTVPTYFSVGPSEFWCANSSVCGGSDFGVFSTGITATTPLSFIPSQYGGWHLYAGFQYFNLLNTALVDSQKILVGTNARSLVSAFGGVSFGF